MVDVDWRGNDQHESRGAMFGDKFGAQRGVGGTPGGLTEFVVGALMIIVGGYLFFNNLVVSSSLSVVGPQRLRDALLILLAGIGCSSSAHGRGWAGSWWRRRHNYVMITNLSIFSGPPLSLKCWLCSASSSADWAWSRGRCAIDTKFRG
jgi:hypothetical protein